jgi:hypothetical protein
VEHTDTRPAAAVEPSENPLAKRRNADALKLIVGKQPSLKPTMRSRKNK